MYRLESNHRGRNRTTGRKVTPITDVASIAFGRKERPCTVRLFGANNFKEGTMWRIYYMQEVLSPRNFETRYITQQQTKRGFLRAVPSRAPLVATQR
jgi:hypothetical protein